MDLLKRHHRETAEPAAAAPAAEPAPAWGRAPDAPGEGPHERETARTPVTSVREATDPRGTEPVEPRHRTWFRRHADTDADADGDRRDGTHAAAAAAVAATRERDLDRDGVPDGVEHDADRRRDRGRERPGPERVGVVDEVVIRHWSIADAVTTAIGGALAAVGGVGLARAEVNSTWYEPVVQVAGADHTPLLAAAELAAGVLIVLVGVARRRILSTLFGAALAVGAAVLALQVDEARRELAIESWWAWLLCGAGVLVTLMALVPRKGRIERVERPGEPAERPAQRRDEGHARLA